MYRLLFLLTIPIFSLSEEILETISIKVFKDEKGKEEIDTRPFEDSLINLHNRVSEPEDQKREDRVDPRYPEDRDMMMQTTRRSKYTIEVGLRYRPLLYSKYQSDIFAESHLVEFYNSWSSSFAPYLIVKSEANRLNGSKRVGWFTKHSLDYYSIDKQRGVYSNGAIDSTEVDLGTELSVYSYSFLPTVFLYSSLSENHRVAGEFSFGGGFSVLNGTYALINYPTQAEYNANPSAYSMLGDRHIFNGGIASYSNDFALHFIYSFTLKYIYKRYNFHISMENPFIIKDDYWNITLFSIGLGYSF
jgi:hypothetical protein